MELKDFIGKTVVHSKTKMRYKLKEITSPYIMVRSEKANENGHYSHYCWQTINGDPISNGILIFEDESLTKPFLHAYHSYCHTEDARWESYGYWMRKD